MQMRDSQDGGGEGGGARATDDPAGRDRPAPWRSAGEGRRGQPAGAAARRAGARATPRRPMIPAGRDRLAPRRSAGEGRRGAAGDARPRPCWQEWTARRRRQADRRRGRRREGSARAIDDPAGRDQPAPAIGGGGAQERGRGRRQTSTMQVGTDSQAGGEVSGARRYRSRRRSACARRSAAAGRRSGADGDAAPMRSMFPIGSIYGSRPPWLFLSFQMTKSRARGLHRECIGPCRTKFAFSVSPCCPSSVSLLSLICPPAVPPLLSHIRPEAAPGLERAAWLWRG